MRERNAKNVYQQQVDTGSREEMVTKYMPLIRKLAGKLSIALPPSLD